MRKWQGDFLYLRRHGTQTWNSAQRLQQPFRMQSSVIYDVIIWHHTVSSMMRKKELLPGHHWIVFFKRVGRTESNKEPEPVLSESGVSEIAACPPSPIAHDPPALPSPTSSPSSGQLLFLPFHSMPVVKNPPTNAGDTDLILGPGGFHTPWRN